MEVQEVWQAEYYRDGGSYSFCFIGEDGKPYEFISQVVLLDSGAKRYKAPVIFWDNYNSGKVVKALDWQEAKDFIDKLVFDNDIFQEFKALIAEYAELTPTLKTLL